MLVEQRISILLISLKEKRHGGYLAMGTIKGHESNALLTCLSIPCVFTFIVFSLCATLLCIDAKTIYDPILCYQYVHSSYGLVILSISLAGDERIDFKQQMRCLLMGVLSVCIGELLFIVISNVIDMSFNTTTFDGKTYQKYTEIIAHSRVSYFLLELLLESARISFFSSVSTILNSSLKSGNLLVATPIPLYYFLVTAFSSSRTAFSFYNIYHGVCIPGNDIQSILISLILFIGLSGIAILFILFFSKREKNDNR